MANEEIKEVVETAEKVEKKPFHKDAPKGEFKGKKPPFKKDGRRPDKKDDRFSDKVIYINSVSKTVKGGRRRKFAALVAVGDKRGNIGFAQGKAVEVPDAIKKATEAARKNIIHVSISRGDTIQHEVIGEFGACRVFLKPAPVGTGVIAGGPVRDILELAGIKNIYSKIYGSRTAINVVRATVDGLLKVKSVGKVCAIRGKQPKDIL